MSISGAPLRGGGSSVSRNFRNTAQENRPWCRATRLFAISIAVLALTVHAALARVDVKIDFDKAFNFKAVRTWGWNPAGPGDVKMARTKDDDPDAMKRRAEPVDPRRGDDRDDSAVGLHPGHRTRRT